MRKQFTFVYTRYTSKIFNVISLQAAHGEKHINFDTEIYIILLLCYFYLFSVLYFDIRRTKVNAGRDAWFHIVLLTLLLHLYDFV